MRILAEVDRDRSALCSGAFPPLALDVIAYGAQNDRPLVSRLRNIGMLADSCRKANASIPNPGESFTAIGSARSSTSLLEPPFQIGRNRFSNC